MADTVMETRRLELDADLRALLGSTNVYFQPPETKKLEYPCFIYERVLGEHTYASNKTYKFVPQYEVTHISRDPRPSIIEDMVNHFPMIRYNRRFVTDNLYHDVFIIYK